MGLLTPRRTVKRALTAASTPNAGKVGNKTAGNVPITGTIAQAWQQDAQALYDMSGPLKYAGMYRGNMYRRVRLYAAVLPEDEDDDPISIADILDPDNPIEAPPGMPRDLLEQAVVEFARIRHAKFGRAGLLYDWGVNLTISGDSWLVVEPDDYEPNGESWGVYSVTELVKQGTWADGSVKWQLVGPPSRVLPIGSTAFRIYSPHPHRHTMADSPTMGVLDDLEELQLIKRSFRGNAKSRITGSGLLLVPDELDFGTVDPDDDESPDNFSTDMLKHFSAPLADESSAANQMPHLVRGAAEFLKPDVFRHIPFDRPGDKILDDREDKGLKRFAIGMDTPPEVILGIGDVNHWGSWQVSESSWKAHGEPGMIQLCAQLGAVPLRALLTASSEGDSNLPRWPRRLIGRISVWFNPHALIDHPDQFNDAAKAHEDLVLSDAALRKYGNFTDEDAPSDDEIAKRVERYRLMHARGAVAGDVQVADVAGPGAPPTPQGPPPAGPPAGETSPATPPAQKATTASALVASARPVGQRLADLDLALYSRVHGMCQTAVRRQLEKAGAQITSRAQKNRPVADKARAVAKHQVAATLGRTVVAALGLADADLVGEYTDLLDQVDEQTSRTRKTALAAIIALAAKHGHALTAADLVEYEANAARSQEDGRTRLAAALAAFTTGQLYALDPIGDERGEGVEPGDLPPGVVRSSLAVYGGQQIDESGRPVDDIPVRGVAGGADILDIGATAGLSTSAWVWTVGAPMRPFEPHQELDGQVFGDGGSNYDRLNNDTENWTGSSIFWPGDHVGCQCSAEPLISAGDAS